MTFIEFKKALLDAELTIPKFCELLKINEKNIQAYKSKESVPNVIASTITCFVYMKKADIDYRSLISDLDLSKKTKPSSGFANKKESEA